MRNIATERLPSSDKEYSQQKISCLTDDKDISSIFKESRAVQTVRKYLIMDSLCYKLIKTQCCYANGLVLKIHVSFSALDELYIE